MREVLRLLQGGTPCTETVHRYAMLAQALKAVRIYESMMPKSSSEPDEPEDHRAYEMELVRRLDALRLGDDGGEAAETEASAESATPVVPAARMYGPAIRAL